MTNDKRITPIDALRADMHGSFDRQIGNYLGGDEKQKMKFMTAAVHIANKVPKLLECDRNTLLEAFMTCAQFNLFPSAASGEAFILPYKGKAQFQLGYQGIITLLFRAGAKDVIAEIVRKNDKFTLKNGKVNHEVDPTKSREERGEPIGAYAIITNATGGTAEAFMRAEDIEAHAKKFSQSYGSDFSPWKAGNDPEMWMWRKTVLKQAAKLTTKNETLWDALERDNADSTIKERRTIDTKALKEGAPTMGSLAKNKNGKGKKGSQAGLDFGIADNHSEETGGEETERS